MRTLNRNKRQVYYALHINDEPILDEHGNETSETAPVYGEPVALLSNVSGATGADAVQAFGNFTNYSRTMCVADPNCPIDENAIVWFGVSPTDPHNYIVTRKADSKNGILYALREVTVT
jgi:hypothetical protein